MSYNLEATYGKQSVPVFKVTRRGKHHSIIDMVVKVMLEGDVKESWLSGENHQIVPTETQKNTCYALAQKTEFDCSEDYAVALGTDLLARHRHIQTVRLEVSERMWERVTVDGQEHNHAFMSAKDPIKRFCRVVVTRHGHTVTSGLNDVKLMKTTQSGFKGFIKDEYTNLQPVGAGSSSPDRIMCTQMESEWTYSRKPARGYAATNKAVMQTLIDQFAGEPVNGKFSKSLQETAYAMTTTVLDRYPEINEVFMATPNVHFYTYPLEQFGLSNPNVVFQSTDCASTASGRIVTRLSRPKAKL